MWLRALGGLGILIVAVTVGGAAGGVVRGVAGNASALVALALVFGFVVVASVAAAVPPGRLSTPYW